MGLPNKPLEHTRPETIATPVNKPREAQSLWELPALRPSGGALSFWPWYYIYNCIILYTIIYRAPRVANGNNHFLLHAAVHPGLHCTEFDGWTLIGCYVTHVTQWPHCWAQIGCHHVQFASKLKYFNLGEFVAAQILVNALACARRKCGATNLNLTPVFSRNEKFARYTSLRSICMGSCRSVAFGAHLHSTCNKIQLT